MNRSLNYLINEFTANFMRFLAITENGHGFLDIDSLIATCILSKNRF